MLLSGITTRKSVFTVLCLVMICVASQATPPMAVGSLSHKSGSTDVRPVAEVAGGFMNLLTLSPACMQAMLVTAVACSQVGLAGLAGCGFLLNELQVSCP